MRCPSPRRPQPLPELRAPGAPQTVPSCGPGGTPPRGPTPTAASEWSHAPRPQRTLGSDRLRLGTREARPPPQPRASRQRERGRPVLCDSCWAEALAVGFRGAGRGPIVADMASLRREFPPASRGPCLHGHSGLQAPWEPHCVHPVGPAALGAPGFALATPARGAPCPFPIPPPASRDSVPSPGHTARTGAATGAPSA